MATAVRLLNAITALKTRSAIRVFPVVMVVQIVVAVLLAPILAGEDWRPDPILLVVLGLSVAVVAAGTRALSGATAVEAAIAPQDA